MLWAVLGQVHGALESPRSHGKLAQGTQGSVLDLVQSSPLPLPGWAETNQIAPCFSFNMQFHFKAPFDSSVQAVLIAATYWHNYQNESWLAFINIRTETLLWIPRNVCTTIGENSCAMGAEWAHNNSHFYFQVYWNLTSVLEQSILLKAQKLTIAYGIHFSIDWHSLYLQWGFL